LARDKFVHILIIAKEVIPNNSLSASILAFNAGVGNLLPAG